MKHGKAPTKAQKIFLMSFNLAPEDWLIVKNTDKEMLLISRHTGHTKIIPKWRNTNDSN